MEDSRRMRLFVDMDGTLTRLTERLYEDGDFYPEKMDEKDLFLNLRPFANMVDGISLFIEQYPQVEVYILSSSANQDRCEQKHTWLDIYLPQIDIEHRIYSQDGSSKAGYVDGRIGKDDWLLDDFNDQLRAWQKAGGSSVKCKNDRNHRGTGEWGGDVGRLWEGPIVDNQSEPEEIVKAIAAYMGVERERTSERAGDWLGSARDVLGESSNHLLGKYHSEIERVESTMDKPHVELVDGGYTLINEMYVVRPDDVLERVYEKQLETEACTWFGIEEETDENGNTVMFRKGEDGSLSYVSNNYFAWGALIEELGCVWRGETKPLFISDRAKNALDDLAADYEWDSSAKEQVRFDEAIATSRDIAKQHESSEPPDKGAR